MKKEQRKLLILSSLGGILEFYDFIIYALFASYISTAFFPASNPLSALIVTYATFAIGYLVRPLGGFIFGHFGDRYGRKSTFTISILIMAFATLGIGIIPSYTSIGILAPILVISLRIMQGLSVGGEIPGAITYASESLPTQKGMACGIIFCGILLGIVFGSIVQACILTVFNETQMQSYAWRFPFILGGVLGLFSYRLRRGLHESKEFLNLAKHKERFPIISVFKESLFQTISGAFLIAVCAAIITSLFLFTPAYFSKVLNLPASSYIWQRTTAIAFAAAICIFVGRYADLVNLKKAALVITLLTAVLAYPIYAIFAYYPKLYFLAFIASGVLTGVSAGIGPVMLSELYPTKIRYSGIAASYNLGFAIFGGLTPFNSLSLIYYTHSITSPALYLIVIAALGALALFLLPNKQLEIDSQSLRFATTHDEINHT